MRTSFHHQPEAQHPSFPLSTSRQADYPIFRAIEPTSPNDRVCQLGYEAAAPYAASSFCN
jgi:CHASE1-domain containing sensor protein